MAVTGSREEAKVSWVCPPFLPQEPPLRDPRNLCRTRWERKAAHTNYLVNTSHHIQYNNVGLIPKALPLMICNLNYCSTINAASCAICHVFYSITCPNLSFLFLHAGGLGSGTVISLESAKALDFLICCSKHGKRMSSLSELASSSGEMSKSGYSKVQTLIFVYVYVVKWCYPILTTFQK